MIAAVLLVAAGVVLLGLIGMGLYVVFGTETWSERNRDERRNRK